MAHVAATTGDDSIQSDGGLRETNDDITSLNVRLKNGWPSVAVYIALAGAIYPMLVAAIFCIFSVVFGRPSDASEFIGLFLIVATIGGGAGLMLATLATLVVLPIAYLVIRSLKLRGSIIWLGAFCGGLAGFTAVIGLMISLHMFQELSDGPGMALALLIGPAVTTVLGQIGGAWGGYRATKRDLWYERAVAMASVAKTSVPIVEPTHSDTAMPPERKPRLQFGIRHLLWFMVWFSLLLSIVRVSGIRFSICAAALDRLDNLSGSNTLDWRSHCSARTACGGAPAANPFHVKQPAAWPQLVRFTWNTQNADRRQTTQPAKSFHVKRVGPSAVVRDSLQDANCYYNGTTGPLTYSSGLITSPLSSFG